MCTRVASQLCELLQAGLHNESSVIGFPASVRTTWTFSSSEAGCFVMMYLSECCKACLGPRFLKIAMQLTAPQCQHSCVREMQTSGSCGHLNLNQVIHEHRHLITHSHRMARTQMLPPEKTCYGRKCCSVWTAHGVMRSVWANPCTCQGLPGCVERVGPKTCKSCPHHKRTVRH